jgi:hypothetical protein
MPDSNHTYQHDPRWYLVPGIWYLMVYTAGREWRDDVWQLAVERFERRIVEDVSRARVEILRSSF